MTKKRKPPAGEGTPARATSESQHSQRTTEPQPGTDSRQCKVDLWSACNELARWDPRPPPQPGLTAKLAKDLRGIQIPERAKVLFAAAQRAIREGRLRAEGNTLHGFEVIERDFEDWAWNEGHSRDWKFSVDSPCVEGGTAPIKEASQTEPDVQEAASSPEKQRQKVDAAHCLAVTSKGTRHLTEQEYLAEVERHEQWGIFVDMVCPVKQGRYTLRGRKIPRGKTLHPTHALLCLRLAHAARPIEVGQLGFLDGDYPRKTVERLRREHRHAAGGDIFRTHAEPGKGTAYSWSAPCSWCFLAPETLLQD